MRLLLLLAAGLALMGNAMAAPANETGGTLSVTGVGTVTVTPDVAKVYLAVSVTKPSAKSACEEAATTTSKVRDALESVQGIAPEDITTENYSVSPNYNYSPDGTSSLTGYTCAQSMVVKINGVNNTNLASVIDSAVQAGGNNLQVSQVSMDLSPQLRKSATDEARTAAVDDATSTADLLAKAAKVTLGSVKSIADNNQVSPGPVPMAAAADTAMMSPAEGGRAPSTPVQVGSYDVVATVSMEYHISG